MLLIGLLYLTGVGRLRRKRTTSSWYLWITTPVCERIVIYDVTTFTIDATVVGYQELLVTLNYLPQVPIDKTDGWKLHQAIKCTNESWRWILNIGGFLCCSTDGSFSAFQCIFRSADILWMLEMTMHYICLSVIAFWLIQKFSNFYAQQHIVLSAH